MPSRESDFISLSGGIIIGISYSPTYFLGKVKTQFLSNPGVKARKYFLYLFATFTSKVCCFFGRMRGGITFETVLVVNTRYAKIVKKARTRIFDDFVGKLKLKIKECYELI